jgi:hypothetical protein
MERRKRVRILSAIAGLQIHSSYLPILNMALATSTTRTFHYFSILPVPISDGSFFKKAFKLFIALPLLPATPERSIRSYVLPIVDIWFPLHIFRDNRDFSHNK